MGKMANIRNMLRGSYARKKGVLLCLPSVGGFNRVEQLLHAMAGGALAVRPDFPWAVEPFGMLATQPITVALNACVRKFMDETDYEYIAFWDHDAVPPDNWFDLFGRGDIVTGLTWMWDDKRAPEKRIQFNQFRLDDAGHSNTIIPTPEQLQSKEYEIDACGTHCLVVHRRVFEKIGNAPFIEPPTPEGGVMMSCDVYFCRVARAAGFKVLAIPTVTFDHSKAVLLGRVYETLLAIAALNQRSGYQVGYAHGKAGMESEVEKEHAAIQAAANERAPGGAEAGGAA